MLSEARGSSLNIRLISRVYGMSSGVVGTFDLSAGGRPEVGRWRRRNAARSDRGIWSDPDCYLDSGAAAERAFIL